MKDIFKLSLMGISVILAIIFRHDIANFVTDYVLYRGDNRILTYNEYHISNDYLYVQNTDNNYAKNYQEVLNIIYTIINSGDECYSFYCDYDTCIEDVKKIIDNKTIVSNINNFVHPYNSFDSLNINIGLNGKITLTIDKQYKEEEIEFVNYYIDEFDKKFTNISMNNYDKIKVFHDQIVNTTKYDENKTFEKYTAHNLITSGISICGGYSDIMSIYLHRLGLKNYKITSENHVWNLVELDGIWYHLDATWDDPIANDGNQYLIHNFFMISTEELLKLDSVQHNYDKNTYLEAK